MKTSYIFNLFIAFFCVSLTSMAQDTARLQAIHNAPDAALAVVDVYVSAPQSKDRILLKDFAFRSASPFIDAPAGVPLTLKITAPGGDSSEPLYQSPVLTLTEGKTYVVVADGILSESGYEPTQAFGLQIYDKGQESAGDSANTDVLVHHGSTDAPTVDVNVQGGDVLVDDISYTEFKGYLELPTQDYAINVTTADGATVVKAYDASLASLGLANQAITVVASGFLNPANNNDGAAFGLFVALSTGGPLVALPESSARVQVIHNSADAAAATVDIYLNDALLLDDVKFRSASPFINAPAGVPLSIEVAPSTSTSSMDAIYELKATLTSGSTYILVADGIVSKSGYEPAQDFGIIVYDIAREAASSNKNTDLLVHHGSTDAPTVDVNVQGGDVLVNDISYTEFAGYLELPTQDYAINVSTGDGATVVKAYDAPLATLELANQAITVVASGFLNPANNNDGAAFGLFVALSTGGPLVALPESSARVQVIHNSADAAAATVDIYLNDALLLDDVKFRNASPFINAPAGVPLSIEVAPSTSTSSMDAIYELKATLASGSSYILVADGIVSKSGYEPAQDFGIVVYDMAREAASDSANTDVLVHHGSTDAPTVDVNVQDGDVLVNDISYTEFAGYLELPTQDYAINVSSADGTAVVEKYLAPLQTLGLKGAAITVLASGFLVPENNSNGAAFGLYAATTAGGALVPLPINNPLSTKEFAGADQLSVYPNPVLGGNDISISLPKITGDVDAIVYDLSGRQVLQTILSKETTTLNTSSLETGIYLMTLNKGNEVVSVKVSVN